MSELELEEHGLRLEDLTPEQLVELFTKERIYGTAFAIQDAEGNIEIKGLGETKEDE